MYWLGLFLQWSSVALQLCILGLMARRKLCWRFQVFAAYAVYIVCITSLRSIFLSNRDAYFYIYWATEPGEIALGLFAVHESFHRVFRAFYGLWWFRLFFPCAIVLALAYSGWS